jgi:hypothetical protein
MALGGGGCADDTGTLPVYEPTTRLLVFSDPHYYAPALGTTGSAFADAVAHDRKLIAESDAVLRALVGLIAADPPAFVLIPGDLTKDGERPSHEAVAAYLRQIEAQGREVLVVPGNHDIQNDHAASYADATVTPVDAISAADFAAIYEDFGYRDALARDPASLSYVAELVPGLWLLALDSCIYGDTRGSSATSGRFTQETRTWIEGQLQRAARAGARVLAMMHHGLVEHFGNQALIFPEYLVADRDGIAALLSNGGVGAVFTGHFHANDITEGTPAGSLRRIYDIETGSAVTYPCPYRVVDVASDMLAITTKHIAAIDYHFDAVSDFQTYAHDSLRVGLDALISGIIQAPPYAMPPEKAASVAPWLGDGLLGHYAGDEIMPADASAESQALLAAPTFVEQLSGVMLQSIWTDLLPADNTVTLDLAAR